MINFNRSQSLGLDINRHIAIDAGAGTGKTTVMASRYLQHLLSSDQRATRLLPSAPRIPLQGMGAIRCPSRERTSLDEWPGLLPTETVAITFTRKAAAELKGRIRRLIASLRAQPVGQDDIDGIHDSRLRNQGDVAMLLSLVDDAPISTIDAFLSSIVSPWMGLVCEDPTTEQVDEDGAVFLRDEAIRTAWRLQRGIDGIEAGMSGDIESFLESRDRLSVLLGGQASSTTVVKGMLKRSLFVEEASRRLDVVNLDNLDADSLNHLFTAPIADFIDAWYTEFRGYVTEWCDAWLDSGAQFVTGADVITGMTRYRYVQHLCTLDADEQIERLQWIWLVSHAITTAANLDKIVCNALYRARPPSGKGWPSGVMTKGDCPLSNPVKDMITANAQRHALDIREMLHTSQGLLIRVLGQSSHLLNPLFDDPDEVPERILGISVLLERTSNTSKKSSASNLMPSLCRREIDAMKCCNPGSVCARILSREVTVCQSICSMHELIHPTISLGDEGRGSDSPEEQPVTLCETTSWSSLGRIGCIQFAIHASHH